MTFNVFKLPAKKHDSRYEVSHVINYGTYGIILDASKRGSKDDRDVCIKINYILEDWIGIYSWKEASILRSVEHPNVLNLDGYEIYQDGDQRLHDAPLDLIDKMTHSGVTYDGMIRDPLAYVMQKGEENLEVLIIEQRVSSADHSKIINQIQRGLEYLHEKIQIAHLDIKPNNVLKFSNRYKICDFGFSRPLGNNENCGFEIMNIVFRPPELLLKIDDQVTTKLDIWCLGMSWMNLILGTPDLTYNDMNDHLNLYNRTNRRSKISIRMNQREVFNQVYQIMCFDNVREEDIEYIESSPIDGIRSLIRLWRWAKNQGIISYYSVKHNLRLSSMVMINPRYRRLIPIPVESMTPRRRNGPIVTPISGAQLKTRISVPSTLKIRDDRLLYISDLPRFKRKISNRDSIFGHYLYNYIGYHKEFYEYLRSHVDFSPELLMMTTNYIGEKINTILEHPTILSICDEDKEKIRQLEIHIGKYTDLNIPLHMIYNYMSEFERENDVIRTQYMLYLLDPGVYSMTRLAMCFDHINENRDRLLPTNLLTHLVSYIDEPDTFISNNSEYVCGMIQEYLTRFRRTINQAICRS